MDLKKEIKKLKKVKGKIRGEGILTNLEYIRYRKGEEGIKAVTKRLKELGEEIDFKSIRPMEWYPVYLDTLMDLAIMDALSWTEKDIFEMGNFAPKVSFLMRMMMKYFVSAKMSFTESPKYWNKNFDIGKLEAHEFNVKEKYMIFRVKNFKVHPITCVNHAGYFLRMAQFVLKSEKITIEETKCIFKGDPFHEYTIRWE